MRTIAVALFLVPLLSLGQCCTTKRVVIDYTPCGEHILGGSAMGDAIGLQRGDTLRMRLKDNTRWLTMRYVECIPDTACKRVIRYVDGYKCQDR